MPEAESRAQSELVHIVRERQLNVVIEKHETISDSMDARLYAK